MKFIIYPAFSFHDSCEADSLEEAQVLAEQKWPGKVLEVVQGDKATKRFDREKRVWVEREEKKQELNEHVLPDDYPVYGDYLYVADGKVVRSDWHGITVGALKKKLGATEIRNCDIFGRQQMKKSA